MNLLSGVDNEILIVAAISCFLSAHLTRLLYRRFSHFFRQNTSTYADVPPDFDLASFRSRESCDSVDKSISTVPVASCPICLDGVAYTIETNCQHCFCGTCFCAFWQQSSPLVQLNCPVCRSPLGCLTKRFTLNELNKNSAELREVESKVDLFNRQFSGVRISFLDRVRDFPVLFYYSFPSLLDGGGIFYLLRMRLMILSFFIVFYIISPLDLLPTSLVSTLGLLDDVVILLLFCLYAASLCRHHFRVNY